MALYRKYRPATFAEVVGQEQVTKPLSAALDAGRINHAYLFSGPRGCGKTSSARIMARSLNCEQGPTSTPCGVCESCVSLAPGGPGNLDVTELDAASHNGVEDMRELRDRAYYAPAESRYRIFIIDEAHMISASGANALLKVVEEPPEHVIFIFATTEPEKIIGTIRSRTHHYPFRLLTPPAMKGLLERTVASEGVHVDDSVYPMVIQAGGGSPRDTLSILDQLLAGAGPDGLTYDIARPLLGVTDLGLLDKTIEALAEQDKAALFMIVDDVIEAGHEPRRFTIDLLDRLRDLMILQAVPGALEAGLVSAPTDRGEILLAQAQRFTGPQLAYLAETVNSRISSLRGATSPRLLLEILCAHLLVGSAPAAAAAGQTAALPQGMPAGSPQGASDGTPAAGHANTAVSNQPAPATAQAQDPAAAAAAIIAARRNRQAQQQAQQQQAQAPQAQPEQSASAQQPQQSEEQPAERAEQAPQQRTETQPVQESAQEPAKEPAQRSAQEPAQEHAVDVAEQVRSQWSNLRAAVGRRNKVAEIMLAEARVLGFRDDTLILGHTTGALAERINSPSNNDVIVAVLKEELRRDIKVNCIIGTNPKAAGFSESTPRQQPTWNPNQQQRESAESEQESERPSPQTEPEQQSEQSASASASASDDPWGAPRPIGTQNNEPAREESPGPVTPAAASAAAAAATAAASAHQPAPQATPPAQVQAPRQQAAKPAQQSSQQGGDWRSRIAQASQVAQKRDEEFNKIPQFGNGVPLPPEPAPEDDFEAPPEEYYPADPQPSQPGLGQQNQEMGASASTAQPPQQAYSRDEQEREMMEEAQNAGEMDHRSSTEVAMELLTKELGARRL
ncbi:DNA polymerase III subunit gamma/tau [Corynebacterium sp. HMSC06D04]|uniref:DNA polymerase III subunit gamma and tau n=2 Tax=Corynebacteriaceae TaxID=1653 RepID=UPI0007804AC8|nr:MULTISPECIES: DNA polymerase III subunit gamma and tau [Corynebacterium]OFR40916.1 DNA polymerase III subunit gamma/tau [Corynebacterium sp. HMSC077D03]OFT51371.1 DNA polymerase III subunit gamma/tau [Corynebacterium sp. HMSC06D04]OHO69097.1 DNA polymerase III subunit gamma/tau [Corynebacterium sp. HMSC036D03]